MTSDGEMSWTGGVIPAIAPDAVAGIVSGISDLALVVSHSGQIKAAQSSASLTALDDMTSWVGRQIQDFLTVESVPKFESRLAQFLEQDIAVQPVQVNHVASENTAEFPVRYSFHRTGSKDTLLVLGNDLSSTSEIQQQLVAAHIALENDYEAQREHDLRFRVLLESSDLSTAFISVRTGKIVACNSAFETMFSKNREVLIGAFFAQEFKAKGRGDLVDQLVSAASEQLRAVVAVKSADEKVNLSIKPTLYRGADGPMLLCKISTDSAQDMPSDRLQSQLMNLYHHGVDPIVFVDDAGQILSANDAFLNFTDVTHSQSLKGRAMIDFFSRGAVDLNVMLENARRTGSMRLYATKVLCEHGSERAVEISTTLLKAGISHVFAMILRDSRRVETVRTPMQQITEVDMRSVIELIGGHSLKDIVAKSTDVIEKMCIETAVEMTSNNRVAAAEMLGLSRQSLYVKLRKYGLVNKT